MLPISKKYQIIKNYNKNNYKFFKNNYKFFKNNFLLVESLLFYYFIQNSDISIDRYLMALNRCRSIQYYHLEKLNIIQYY